MNDNVPDMSSANIKTVDSRLYNKAVAMYGSWKNALESNGIDYSKVLRKRENGYWSKERVAKALVEDAENELIMTPSEFASRNYGAYKGAIRAYGSFADALESNGIEFQGATNSQGRIMLGRRFEKVVINILDDLGTTYDKHKRTPDGLIPDITLKNNVIFDVKLSNYSDREGITTKTKYERDSKLLGIIFLMGNFDKTEYITNGVLFRHVTYYIKQLPRSKRRYYERIVDEIKRDYYEEMENQREGRGDEYDTNVH